MDEEQACKYSLLPMLSSLQRDICGVDPSQDTLAPHVAYVCLDFPYSDAWFLRRRTHCRSNLDFEHRIRDRVPPHRHLLHWHNVEIFATRPEICSRIYVFTGDADWASLPSSRFLLVPTPTFFSYYRNRFLAGRYCWLVLNNARLEFAIRVALQFQGVDGLDPTDTFKVDTRLRVGAA